MKGWRGGGEAGGLEVGEERSGVFTSTVCVGFCVLCSLEAHLDSGSGASVSVTFQACLHM